MSRQMIIGYLTALVGVLALPDVLTLIPDYLWLAAIVSGAAAVLLRWLNGEFGLNFLSLVGIAGMVAGILEVQPLLDVIPANAMPYVLAIQGILQLLARYVAGASATDKALKVGLLMHTTPPGEVQT